MSGTALALSAIEVCYRTTLKIAQKQVFSIMRKPVLL